MRILFHGVAPWFPTGYGTQTAVWARRMRDEGHEVIISAQAGATMCHTVEWQGIPVLPSPLEAVAIPEVLKQYMALTQPDLTLFLHDVWNFEATDIFHGQNVAAWLPTDTSPLAIGDKRFLHNSGVRPIAMSRHGEKMIRDAGFNPLYVPHGIDTLNLWTPATAEERAGMRAELGIPEDAFLVGSVGQNLDPRRKSWSEHMLAFSKFHAKHPESIYSVSTMIWQQGSLDIRSLARACDLEYPALRFTEQTSQYTGTMPQELMADWYRHLDVLLNCTHGEGFGLAAIEAQACGTPVINIRAHTGPELAGPGWLVGGQPFWNPVHQAWWSVPSIPGIVRALEEARTGASDRREASRAFAEGYDIETVWPYWEKALQELDPHA